MNRQSKLLQVKQKLQQKNRTQQNGTKRKLPKQKEEEVEDMDNPYADEEENNEQETMDSEQDEQEMEDDGNEEDEMEDDDNDDEEETDERPQKFLKSNFDEKVKTKQSASERRQAKIEKLKSVNPNFDRERKAKTLLEQFRQVNKESKKEKKLKQRTAEERKQLEQEKLSKLQQIMDLTKGMVFNFCLQGDMSRVVQTLLKYGTNAMRKQICQELKGKIVELSKNIYGHNCVIKLFNYTFKQEELKANRQELFADFNGSIFGLLTKKFGASVIDEIYDQYSNETEKLALVKEFYGSSFDVASDPSMAKKSLADILNQFPAKKLVIAQNLAEAMKKIITKGLLDHRIVHRLLADSFEACDRKDITDLVIDLVDAKAVPYILHTEPGAKTSILLFSYANMKSRKEILKTLKDIMMKAASDLYGCLVLCRIVDVYDDTVFISDHIFKELMKQMDELLTNKTASQLILHLFSPYNKHYMPNPNNTELLQIPLRKAIAPKAEEEQKSETEQQQQEEEKRVNPTLYYVCKKPLEKKHKEILQHILPTIYKYILKEENLKKLLTMHHSANIIFEMLRIENYAKIYQGNDALCALRVELIQKLIALVFKSLTTRENLLEAKESGKLVSMLILKDREYILAQTESSSMPAKETFFSHHVYQTLEKTSQKLEKFIFEQSGLYTVTAFLKMEKQFEFMSKEILKQLLPLESKILNQHSSLAKQIEGASDKKKKNELITKQKGWHLLKELLLEKKAKL